MDSYANHEPWKQTIISLQRASRASADEDASNQGEPKRDGKPACTISRKSCSASSTTFSGCIRILERLSSTAVSVCWYDATCGHYADQIWRRTHSRHKTVCTLTGRPVKRGDAVYRPSGRGIRPVNANYLILACVMEDPDALDGQSPSNQRYETGH